MDRDKIKKILTNLKQITASAIKQREAVKEAERQRIIAEDNAIKKSAIDLCTELIIEEKLYATAKLGVGIYPLLHIEYDYVAQKNKKYSKEEIGPLGFYVVEAVERIGYPVGLIQISYEDMYEDSDATKVRLFDERIVAKAGAYICIIWSPKA